MFLTIKKIVLVFFLLISAWLNAQKNDSRNDTLEKDEHYGIFEIGPYYPLAFGNNSANEAFDQKVGGQFVFMFKPFQFPLLLGVHLSFFNAKTTSEPAVGHYDSTTSTVIGPTIGYQILRQRKWRATFRVGVGYVRYHNHSSGFSFKDEGVSLSFTPSLGYHFTKNFGLYLSASYRHDFMQIDAPSSTGSYFNALNYVGFGLGVRLVI